MKLFNRIGHSAFSLYVEYVIGFLVSIIIARNLTQEDYGKYTFLILISSIVILISNGGIGVTAIKVVSKFKEFNLELVIKSVDYLQRLQFIRLFLSIVFMSLFLLAWDVMEIDSSYIILIIVGSMFKAVYIFYNAVLKGMERFDVISRVVLITSIFNLICILYGSANNFTLVNYLSIYLLVSVIYLLIAKFYTNKLFPIKVHTSLSETEKEKNFRVLKPLTAISIIGFFVHRQSEVFFIKYFYSYEEVAQFSVAFALYFAIVSLVPGILSNLLLPAFSRVSADGNFHKLNPLMTLSYRYLAIIIVPISVFIFFFAEEIIILFYGEEYRLSGQVLSILILSLLFAAFSQVTNSYLISSDKANLQLKMTVGTLLLTVILDILLIMMMGIYGAAWAYTIGLVVYQLLSIWKLKNELDKLIDYVLISKLLLLSLLTTSFLHYLYPENLDVIKLILVILLDFIMIFTIGFFLVLNLEERVLVKSFLRFRLFS